MGMLETDFNDIFSRRWWVLLLRGCAAILFGVLTWLWPGISLATLVLLFGAYCLADGVLGAWTAIEGRKNHSDWWILLLWALAGIAVGILTFMVPGITEIVLLFYIALWAILIGVLQLIAAFRLKRVVGSTWLLLLAGLASLVFGGLLIIQPDAGALALLWLIAAYAVFYGVLLVVLAFWLRRQVRY